MASMYQCRNLAMAARSLCARHGMKTPTSVHKCQKRPIINVNETYHECKGDLFARRFMKTPMYTSLALLLALAFFKVSMNCARSCCGDAAPLVQQSALTSGTRVRRQACREYTPLAQTHARACSLSLSLSLRTCGCNWVSCREVCVRMDGARINTPDPTVRPFPPWGLECAGFLAFSRPARARAAQVAEILEEQRGAQTMLRRQRAPAQMPCAVRSENAA